MHYDAITCNVGSTPTNDAYKLSRSFLRRPNIQSAKHKFATVHESSESLFANDVHKEHVLAIIYYNLLQGAMAIIAARQAPQ